MVEAMFMVNRPFPSSLVPLFQNESKCETFFHFQANQTHFHKNGFALSLALKQRYKGTRKWPIPFLCIYSVYDDCKQQKRKE